MKQCTTCGVDKPFTEYYTRSNGKLRNDCKQCCQDKQLEKRYGISLAEYEALYQQQRGVCAVCHLPQKSPQMRLCVDHDHSTGEVRGLLCNDCNRGIGLLKDDSRLLNNAAEYLRTPPARFQTLSAGSVVSIRPTESD